MERSFLERFYHESEENNLFELTKPEWSSICETSGKGVLMDKFSDIDEFQRKELFVNNWDQGHELLKTIKYVLANVQDVNILTYTLMIAEDVLLNDMKRIEFFLDKQGSCILLEELMTLVEHENHNVSGRAAHFSSLFLYKSAEPKDQVVKVLNYIFSKIQSFIDSKANGRNALDVPGGFSGSLLTLTVLLRNSDIRKLIIYEKLASVDYSKQSSEDTEDQGAHYQPFRLLIDCAAHDLGGMGALYNTVVSIWLLTFDKKVRSRAFSAPELNVLVKILKSEPFEKVIRVCLAIIRLVLNEEKSNVRYNFSKGYNLNELSEVLISLQTLRLLDNLRNKKALMKDQELSDDMEWVHKTLVNNYKVLTTFDRHEKELLTEKLTWSSAVHSDAFWKENARLFEKNNFGSIKKLIGLLGSQDETTAAIACYDLGEFVQYYPNGKLIVENFGGKQQIMMLLQHDSVEVQKEALTACSKIMISNWKSVIAVS